MQADAKARGLPWTKAKGFATAACVSAFVPADEVSQPSGMDFSLTVNGVLRQQGDTGMMVFPIPFLISFLSRHYGLTAGDLIYTGTPEGVARLVSGDQLELALQGHTRARFTVA